MQSSLVYLPLLSALPCAKLITCILHTYMKLMYLPFIAEMPQLFSGYFPLLLLLLFFVFLSYSFLADVVFVPPLFCTTLQYFVI